MKLRLVKEEATGYQEPWPAGGNGHPAEMPVVFLHAYVQSDDGELMLTLGRLFFTPEQWANLGGDSIGVLGEGVGVHA